MAGGELVPEQMPQEDLIWALGSICALHRVPFAAKLVARDFPRPCTSATMVSAARAITQAIGGDLAYRYATLGHYGDLGWQAISSRLGSVSGSVWQTLSAPTTTVNPWTALQAGISLIVDQTAALPSPITSQASLSADELAFAAFSAAAIKPNWLRPPLNPGP